MRADALNRRRYVGPGVDDGARKKQVRLRERRDQKIDPVENHRAWTTKTMKSYECRQRIVALSVFVAQVFKAPSRLARASCTLRVTASRNSRRALCIVSEGRPGARAMVCDRASSSSSSITCTRRRSS
jgi:hypothetical protein